MLVQKGSNQSKEPSSTNGRLRPQPCLLSSQSPTFFSLRSSAEQRADLPLSLCSPLQAVIQFLRKELNWKPNDPLVSSPSLHLLPPSLPPQRWNHSFASCSSPTSTPPSLQHRTIPFPTCSRSVWLGLSRRRVRLVVRSSSSLTFSVIFLRNSASRRKVTSSLTTGSSLSPYSSLVPAARVPPSSFEHRRSLSVFEADLFPLSFFACRSLQHHPSMGLSLVPLNSSNFPRSSSRASQFDASRKELSTRLGFLCFYTLRLSSYTL